MNDDTRLDCSDYDYEKRPIKGILTPAQQTQARTMLKAIGENKPFIMAMERVELRKIWKREGMSANCSFDGETRTEHEKPQIPRNLTFAEIDLIKQVDGRIKKGKSKCK